MGIGSELLNAPLPEMVRQLGLSIAEAQFALDKSSIRIAQWMGGYMEGPDGNALSDAQNPHLVRLKADGPRYSLLDLGFAPTFYQFVESVIEVKMAISMQRTEEFNASASIKALFASANARYAQKYQYAAEGSSFMRVKLVAIPAPAALEERIRNAQAPTS